MFLHGGILHILFNMFFLYLSACNIEDLWGRIIFPVFYLLGGVVASLIHGMASPESHTPCIGASGAVAAVMGAFMIRLYKTKIYFFYAFIFFPKSKHGTFHAPAYLMLPLWLIQQLLGALESAGMEGGVAFWAHIGGFVFGAMVATLIKVTGFEENVIAPTIERKTNFVDENYSLGMEKLKEGDMEGAVEYLGKAVENDPDNSIAHSELSKIYCKQGKKKEALSELKRAVNLYMRQGLAETAVDDYLEISSAFPDMVLPPPVQMKLIKAIEGREMYAEAAAACKSLFAYCQSQSETKDSPEAVNALTRYGDICLYHLQKPKNSFNAYKTILESCQYLTSEQKKELKSKAQEAVKAAKSKAEEAKLRQKEIKLKQKETKFKQKEGEEEKKGEAVRPSVRKAKSRIPLKKKIKLIQEVRGPGKYKVKLVAPYKANKVLNAEGGMELSRLSEGPILFDDIYLICVFGLDQHPSIIFADFFLAGKSRPYRIPSKRVVYSEFLSKCSSSSFENFRQFLLNIISYTDSVYLDKETMNFLKTGKARIFTSQDNVSTYEKNLWKQLIGEARFQCGKCLEVYWTDGRKIPEKGARTKCGKCGNPVLVRPARSSEVLS